MSNRVEPVIICALLGVVVGYWSHHVLVMLTRPHPFLRATTRPRTPAWGPCGGPPWPGVPARWTVVVVTASLYTLLDLAACPLPLASRWWLGTAAVLLTWCDATTHRLPDLITVPAWVGLIALLAADRVGHGPGSSQLGRAIAAGLVLAAAYLLAAMLTGAVGLGDAKAAG